MKNYEFIITLKNKGNSYSIEFDNKYDIEIDFNMMSEAQENYNDYRVEEYLNKEWFD